MSESLAPLIVSALFGAADFARLDGLRRTHFPPERNHIPAHLTLFHHLPPSALAEVKALLVRETRGVPSPPARLAGMIKLGRGMAFRVESPKLAEIRACLADALGGLLMPQDQATWRPHVTIQNKVDPATARALHDEFAVDFQPVPLAIAALGLWYYRGGPWEPVARYAFG